jgi:outer membrane protein
VEFLKWITCRESIHALLVIGLAAGWRYFAAMGPKIYETIRRSRTFNQLSADGARLTEVILLGEDNKQMIGRFYRSTLALGLALMTCFAPVSPVFAQQQTGQTPSPQQPSQNPSAPPAQPQPQPPARSVLISQPDYTQARSWFPNVFLPYQSITVPEPVLTNTPTIDQMVQNGQLRLSLQDTIDLALQNNMDIAIQRYTPWLAEANVLRTLAGGISRGTVTPLGNIPSLNFDPMFTTTMSMDQRAIAVNNPLISGVGTAATASASLNTHTATANFGLTQGFHTGTSYGVFFNNSRQSTTSPSVFFNPSLTSTMTITASQQLLNGFGLLPNERYIRIAKFNKDISDQTFRQQVITTVTAVETAYWELVYARGNVDVNKQSVALAQKLYEDNKKQVEIGTLAPLEIVRAEAQLASAQQGLIAAQTTQLQDQIQLLNLITKDPTAPNLLNVEIIPTDSVTTPPLVESVPLQDAIKEAFTKRPDVLQLETTLKADEVNRHASRNALLPVLSLSGTYTTQGLAGNNRILGTSTTVAGSQVVDTNGDTVMVLTSPTGNPIPIFVPSTTTPVTGIAQSGVGDSLSQVFRGVFPEYNAQITLSIPIRNRQAQADHATALLTERQDEAKYRQILNNAAVDVHNAQILLAQDRVTLDAAIKTRELQQETLDAEQKKFQLGASTIFQIVSDQRDLATAASAEVRAMVNLAQAKVNFDRAMGRILETNNITISDAKSGHVSKDTLIPGTAANGALFLDRNKQSASFLTPSGTSSSDGNGQ